MLISSAQENVLELTYDTKRVLKVFSLITISSEEITKENGDRSTQFVRSAWQKKEKEHRSINFFSLYIFFSFYIALES